jgi:pimeloyl-ACP methyl ester carboxylesterase
MMRVSRILATAVVAASFAAGGTAVQAQTPSPQPIIVAQATKRAAASTPRNTGTQVYLLRGFMDIFSTGMDDLTVKLNRRGIRASVHGHAEYPALVDAIVDRWRKGLRENVVIIGHSLGANAAFSMAEDLGKHGIPVPLIIAYDPTSPMTASSNVARVVNFYASNNGWGVAVGRGPGFRGTLSNVDLSGRGEVGHTDIDKSPALHAQSINYIQSIGGGGGGGTSAAAPQAKNGTPEKASGTKPESKEDTRPGDDTAAKPAGDRTETAATPAPAAPTNN